MRVFGDHNRVLEVDIRQFDQPYSQDELLCIRRVTLHFGLPTKTTDML